MIPKEIREKAGLKLGMPLSIAVEDGAIRLEPECLPVRLEKRGHLTVLVPVGEAPPITNEDVNRMLEEIRLERERELLGPRE